MNEILNFPQNFGYVKLTNIQSKTGKRLSEMRFRLLSPPRKMYNFFFLATSLGCFLSYETR